MQQMAIHMNASEPADGRDARIRDAQNAAIERMRADLGAARSTIVTTGRITDGLACHVEQGKFSTVTDLSRGMGGDAAGPSPGFHARAAIAGCVAIAIKMLAAREGHRFHEVLVTVETDFDDSALFGMGCATAAPVETRINIAIDSDAGSDLVGLLVDRALEMDPWYLALRDRQNVTRSVVSLNAQ